MALSGTLKLNIDVNDKGLLSLGKGLTGLENQAKGLGGMFKSVLGANLVSSGITAGLSGIKASIGDVISGLDESSKAWQTFEGNMSNIGMGSKEIQAAKKDMQDFATQTIYSASDMASTYSQLAAVGIKDTGELVKGFGGLAAASSEPTQAMKTLSQQATQMAAKPMVQWQDFKLMLEQTPAGISAVAKTMGKSTSQLVKDVQNGTVKTQEFFDAIATTGTNANFTKMATQFKTVGQAMDGLKEGLTTKLQPAFDKLSKYGIQAVTQLGDKLSAGINPDKLVAMVDKIGPKMVSGLSSAFTWIQSAISNAKSAIQNLWKGFVSTDAIKNVQKAGESIKAAFDNIVKSSGGTGNLFEGFGKGTGKIISEIAQAVGDFATTISKLSPGQLKSIGESIGIMVGVFKVAKNGPLLLLATGLTALAKGVSKLSPGQLEGLTKALAGIVAIIATIKGVSKLTSLASGIGGLFKSTKSGGDPSKPLVSLKDGLNSLAKSAGIALVVSSLAALALAIKPLAALGSTAVPSLVAFGGVVGGLAIIFSKFGAGLQKSMVGIAVFAAAVSIMALAMTPLATASAQAVPNLITFGVVVGGLAAIFSAVGPALQSSAVGIIVFAAAVSIMALSLTGIATAGPQAVANMATFGLVIAGLVVVFAIFGAALTAAIPAMLAFGATILMVGIGLGAAAPFMEALPPVIQAVGNAFATAATAVGNAVSQIVASVSDLVSQIGDSVTQIVDSIGTNLVNVMKQAGDSIKEVVDSISGGITSVLDAVAKVIKSIGDSALNAGKGVKYMAQGISELVKLPLGDLVGTLGAVGKAIADFSSHASELATAGKGMGQVASGLAQIQAFAVGVVVSLPLVGLALTVLMGTAPAAGSAITALGNTFMAALPSIQNFASSAVTSVMGLLIMIPTILTVSVAISGLNGILAIASSAFVGLANSAVGASTSVSNLASNITRVSAAITTMGVIAVASAALVIVSFNLIKTNADQLAKALLVSGKTAGENFAKGLLSTQGLAISAMTSIVNSVETVGSSASGSMYSLGAAIGQSLADGLASAYGAVAAAASSLVEQANKAAKAKASIGKLEFSDYSATGEGQLAYAGYGNFEAPESVDFGAQNVPLPTFDKPNKSSDAQTPQDDKERVIIVELDGKTIAKATVDETTKLQKIKAKRR